MKFRFFFNKKNIKKKLNFIYSILWNVTSVCFAAIETSYCIGKVSVESASRYVTLASRFENVSGVSVVS